VLLVLCVVGESEVGIGMLMFSLVYAAVGLIGVALEPFACNPVMHRMVSVLLG
jgi:hypothetical protein